MPNKSDPMAARGDSNKVIQEFTPEYVRSHNSIPSGNTRKSSGVDRGTSVNHDIEPEGQGEFDKV
jgi:hypothetical protein